MERSVRWLLAALDRLEVPCVVLRGDRELPRLPEAGDLDVACAPRHAAQFERMLRRAAARYGVRIVARHRAGHLRQFQLHGVDAARLHRLVRVELHTAETVCGVPILSARQLLQGRTRKRGHARPDVVISALVDFLGPYLAGSTVRDESLSRLATVMEQWPGETRRLLGDLFGTHMAEELAAGLRDASRTKLFRSAGRARRAALRRALASAPLSSLGDLAASGFALRIRPLFQPRCKVVAVLGTERSGKDELVAALRSALGPAFRATEGGVVKLGLANPGSLAEALAWRATPLPRRRRNALILLDHTLRDSLVIPAPVRMQPFRALARWFARFVPRPDVTLICSSNEHAARDPGHRREPSETQRQLAAYEALAERRADVHIVQTGGALEIALDHAISAIFGIPHGPVVREDQGAATPPLAAHRREVA